MTEDQFWRAAATGAAIPIYGWLLKKAETYLATKRNESGRGLLERLAYRLGKVWAIGYRSAKGSLHRRGV